MNETNWYVCQGCGDELVLIEEPDSCPNCGTLDFEIETEE